MVFFRFFFLFVVTMQYKWPDESFELHEETEVVEKLDPDEQESDEDSDDDDVRMITSPEVPDTQPAAPLMEDGEPSKLARFEVTRNCRAYIFFFIRTQLPFVWKLVYFSLLVAMCYGCYSSTVIDTIEVSHGKTRVSVTIGVTWTGTGLGCMIGTLLLIASGAVSHIDCLVVLSCFASMIVISLPASKVPVERL